MGGCVGVVLMDIGRGVCSGGVAVGLVKGFGY